MGAYSCLLRSPFHWLAVFVSLLALSHASSFGFLTIFLASSAAILCSVIVCRLKPCEQKPAQVKESPRFSTEKVLSESSLQDKLNRLMNEPSGKEEGDEKIEENVAKLEEKTGGKKYLIRSSEALLSDSESLDHTTSSEDSENDSMFRENLSHSTNYSDGSISDEDSLIEIALPTGHYVDSKKSQEQSSWCGFQQKWPDCSLESHFRQQNWTEMLNEMNEENFIEIDLCMGSIKCSRFEIQA